ncbi:MAG: hypothetical protein ABJD97_07315 [Betaproteobacteria bacterium]
MTTISQAQYKAMGQDSFDSRLISILRQNHPEQLGRMEFPTLVGAIHRQSANAQRYGMNDERSVATYIYTAFLLGEEFDRRIPALSQILRERKMPAREKAAALSNFSKLVFNKLGGAPAAARSAA